MLTLVRRLQALALFLLFMSGGGSLSGLDVAFFHLNGKGIHTDVHVESADGGCANHAGHCGLGIPTGTAVALTASPVTPVLHVDQSTNAPPPALSRPIHPLYRAGFQSRAPPTARTHLA